MNTMFPYAEHALNHAISNDPEALAFSARWLGTDEIHYRPGLGMSRYPLDPGLAMEPEPEGWADARTGAHIDNGNNSLLPPTMDRRHSQIIFWFILEDTAADQAPTIVWPTTMTPGGPVADMDSPVAFTGKGGSLCLFHNYTMHAASAYRRADGQRFIWKHAWCVTCHARSCFASPELISVFLRGYARVAVHRGRADYCWEGTAHYTNQGHNTHWREFISQITPRQRELFRLPAAGHDYYTSETLVELEKLYPGFDSSGAYSAALHSRQKLGDRNGPLPWGASAARL